MANQMVKYLFPMHADFCMYLLNVAHVSSVMGDAFGEPDCVRFSFANSMEKIEEGFSRIKKCLANSNRALSWLVSCHELLMSAPAPAGLPFVFHH